MPKIPADRICLIRLSAIGDVINALPLVNGLRRGYPNAHLTWIVQKIPYEAIRYQPGIDRFIIFDRKEAPQSLNRLWRSLREEQFDLVLVPQVGFKASLVAKTLKSPLKLGFDFGRSREFHWLFTNRHIPPRPPSHVLDQYLEFLQYLEIDPAPVEWNIRWTPEESAWKTDFFARFDKPVISFVAATSTPQKDWLPERYAEVIDHLGEQNRFQPLIIGGPTVREREMADAICGRCMRKPVVALENPIRHTLLQIAGSALVVSPDTGPLHASVALGVPVIGLFGYSNPYRCGPYSFRELVINKFGDGGASSERISRKTCPGRMNLIAAAEVIEKIDFATERFNLLD